MAAICSATVGCTGTSSDGGSQCVSGTVQACPCAPGVQDAVIAGQDRDEITALLFPAPLPSGVSAAEQRAHIVEGLRRHNAAHPASSTVVHRVTLETEPPSLDAGETTDKGYLNQRRILERRAATVQRLYSTPPGDEVIEIPTKG